MATIKTNLQLYDGMTTPLKNISNALSIVIGSFESMQDASSIGIDTSKLESARVELSKVYDGVKNIENGTNQAKLQQDKFNNSIKNGSSFAEGLKSKIVAIGASIGTVIGLTKTLALSDKVSQTSARLSLIVDDGGSVEELESKIFQSAENSRASYHATADMVSKLGMQAGDAFSSNDELIAFVEQINKTFVIAGTSTIGAESAMLQLTQAMASGKLQGEELNAILDNAQPIVKNIADYMEVPVGSIKKLASEGMITSDIIKNAMFNATDETNAKFESMPVTFSQVFTTLKNNALMAFQPVLNMIGKITKTEAFNSMIGTIVSGMNILSGVVLNIFNLMASIGGFISDNWSIIAPIIYGIVTALGIYTTALIANNVVQGISATIKGISAFKDTVLAASKMMATGATFAQTAAQHGLNAALLACPITWIVLGIIAIITVLFFVANAVAKFTGVTSSGFSLICGVINVVIQFFWNLLKSVANIALGIGNVIDALVFNMKTAFLNGISNIRSWFYDLLATALRVVAGICEALNKLPFIEFDYSGITSKADEYENKAFEIQQSKGEYKSITDAFDKGFNTFDSFEDGWVKSSFDSGSAWGDSIGNKFEGLFDNVKSNDDFNLSNYGNNLQNSLNGNKLDDIGSGVKDTAGNTKDMRDSMDITEENLAYMRDLAEQEVINRFTTAEIKIDMKNENHVNSEMDLDGIVTRLEEKTFEAMKVMSEGVHV